MAQAFLKIIDSLVKGLRGVQSFKDGIDRKNGVLELLKIYFLFLDSWEIGCRLLASTKGNPLEFISKQEPEVLNSYIELWDKILRQQSVRLHEIQRFVGEQSFISVLSADVQKEISEIVGDKMDRVWTLHQFGAGLQFRNIFPPDDPVAATSEQITQYLAGADSENFDPVKIQSELTKLKQGLDDYRTILESVVTKDEIFKLSNEARELTKIA